VPAGGGTGVAAFTAYLAGLPASYPHQVHLFYGARRPGQLIYRPLVQAVAQRCPGLQVRYYAELDFEGTDCLPGGSKRKPFSAPDRALS